MKYHYKKKDEQIPRLSTTDSTWTLSHTKIWRHTRKRSIPYKTKKKTSLPLYNHTISRHLFLLTNRYRGSLLVRILANVFPGLWATSLCFHHSHSAQTIQLYVHLVIGTKGVHKGEKALTDLCTKKRPLYHEYTADDRRKEQLGNKDTQTESYKSDSCPVYNYVHCESLQPLLRHNITWIQYKSRPVRI